MGRVIFAVMLILVVLLTFFSFWFFKEMYEILPVAEPQQTYPQVNIEEWIEYTDGEKRFSVFLPSVPQHAADVKQDESTGKRKKYEVYSSEGLQGTAYLVIAITHEEPLDVAQKEDELNSVVDKLMKSNENNQLKMRSTSEYFGNEALDILIENQQHVLIAKAFFVDDTFYVLNSLARSDTFNPNEFQFFVNSFHLLNDVHEPDVPSTPFQQSSFQFDWSES